MLKNLNGKVSVHSYNQERFEYLLGRVLTMIEAIGLNSGQEKAFKDIIKQEIWYLWENPWGVEEKVSFIDMGEDSQSEQ